MYLSVQGPDHADGRESHEEGADEIQRGRPVRRRQPAGRWKYRTTHGFDVEQSRSTDPLAKKTEIMALPLARGAPQGCVALCAPVPCTPLPRAGFAVAKRWTAE
jgi:hypothetical protein